MADFYLDVETHSQESLQNIADSCLNVEINNQDKLATYCGLLFRRRIWTSKRACEQLRSLTATMKHNSATVCQSMADPCGETNIVLMLTLILIFNTTNTDNIVCINSSNNHNTNNNGNNSTNNNNSSNDRPRRDPR